MVCHTITLSFEMLNFTQESEEKESRMRLSFGIVSVCYLISISRHRLEVCPEKTVAFRTSKF